MTDDDHRELANVLHQVRGKVALSSYASPLMSELYEDWNCIEAPSRKVHSVKQERVELLWINYSLDEVAETEAPMFELFRKAEE